MTPVDYGFRLRRVCLDRAPASDDVQSLGGDVRRWLRYRRMVRSRLIAVIDQAFPRLGALLGPEAFSEMKARFLESGALASPSLRDVPGEFAGWLSGVRSADSEAVSLPILELARLEWTERAVAFDLDDPDDPLSPLAMDRAAVLTRALRVLAFEYAVHRVDTDRPSTPPREPTWLCVYRDPEALDVRTLELSQVAHALLEELGRTQQPLMTGVHVAASRVGVPVDGAFVRALGELLGDLSQRGVVRGSRTF